MIIFIPESQTARANQGVKLQTPEKITQKIIFFTEDILTVEATQVYCKCTVTLSWVSGKVDKNGDIINVLK